jgi:hypothetical protein
VQNKKWYFLYYFGVGGVEAVGYFGVGVVGVVGYFGAGVVEAGGGDEMKGMGGGKEEAGTPKAVG